MLGGAHALLHLIGFDEPFGFSVAEAMACGTPVVAYDRGSMRELIDDGATGFVVDGVDACGCRGVTCRQRSTATTSVASRSRGSAATGWSTSTSRCTAPSSASAGRDLGVHVGTAMRRADEESWHGGQAHQPASRPRGSV